MGCCSDSGGSVLKREAPISVTDYLPLTIAIFAVSYSGRILSSSSDQLLLMDRG